jgi:hypothetical protein
MSTNTQVRERDQEGAPYVPTFPTRVQVTVTLSNGKTVEVDIDELSSEEKGDLYGGLLSAGVLIGHVVRTAQHELRDAREKAQAYGR